MSAQAAPRGRLSRNAMLWVLAASIGVAGVFVVSGDRPELQMFTSLSLITIGIGAMVIPGMAARDGAIGRRFLMVALLAHIAGALARYVIIQQVYHGVADANAYVSAGSALAPAFRSLSPPPIPAPGTEFLNWLVGAMFAVTGPTMIGGFVLCSVASFVGAWFFYKAFRVAFPDGNNRLYALLIFFIPSMWYWPSSLGKDAIVMLFLGLATYGFALLFSGRVLRGFAIALAGIAGTLMIRPPMGAVVAAAAAIAFILRPIRIEPRQLRGIVWILCIPVFAVLVFATVKSTKNYVGGQGFVEAYESQQTADFGNRGGSDYGAVNALSLKGFPLAIVTVNLRPFPFEAGSPFAAVAALEGVAIALILVFHAREIARGIWGWRSNSMVVYAVAAFLGMTIVLSSLANFGLLARQRTQVLPFLFMLPALIAPIPGRRERRRAA